MEKHERNRYRCGRSSVITPHQGYSYLIEQETKFPSFSSYSIIVCIVYPLRSEHTDRQTKAKGEAENESDLVYPIPTHGSYRTQDLRSRPIDCPVPSPRRPTFSCNRKAHGESSSLIPRRDVCRDDVLIGHRTLWDDRLRARLDHGGRSSASSSLATIDVRLVLDRIAACPRIEHQRQRTSTTGGAASAMRVAACTSRRSENRRRARCGD